MSTVIGNAGQSLELVARSIFSRFFNSDHSSCENIGIKDPATLNKYSKIYSTQLAIQGDGNEQLDGIKFVEVLGISYVEREFYFPDGQELSMNKIAIPKVSFSYLLHATLVSDGMLEFGKYFIYEGLAYELDRIVEMHVTGQSKIDDIHRATEYTVLRRIARYVFPGVDKRTYLTLASFSLQYINCGGMFIHFLKEARAETELGVTQCDSVNKIKEEVKLLLSDQQQAFHESQDELANVFEKREQLHKAMRYITRQAKGLYDHRMLDPSFEVDLVWEGKHRDLLEMMEICDYMYIFADEEDWMRDFLGSAMDVETSKALKVLLSYADYYSAHHIFSTVQVEGTEGHCCPFYYYCNLPLRRDHGNLCKEKPWRVFEISYKSDHQYCWYGQGVLEFKGQNMP